MEYINAKEYNPEEGTIVLKKKEDIEQLWDLLNDNEPFVINYKKRSIMVVPDMLLPKIKNGEILLGAEE